MVHYDSRLIITMTSLGARTGVHHGKVLIDWTFSGGMNIELAALAALLLRAGAGDGGGFPR